MSTKTKIHSPQFREDLLRLLVRDEQFLRNSAHLLEQDDFNPEKGESQAQLQVAGIALEHWKTYNEPVDRKLIPELETDAKLNNWEKGLRIELNGLVKAIFTKPVVSRDYVTDNLNAFRQRLARTKALNEIIGLHEAHALTNEQFLDIVQRAIYTTTDDASSWPDPEEIDSASYDLPEFPLKLLPPFLQAWIKEVYDLTGAPCIASVAVSTLASLAGAVNRRAQVQPKDRNHKFQIVPNLWGFLVAGPGTRKSQIIKATNGFIEQIAQEKDNAHKDALKAYEEELEFWKADKEGPKPEKPIRQRLFTNNTTVEAMEVVLSENPYGIYLLCDELTTWFAGLTRSGQEGARQQWLQLWNGDHNIATDRIKRDSYTAYGVAASVFGSIQDDVMRKLIQDITEHPEINDGFQQRFQLIMWVGANSRVGDNRSSDEKLERGIKRMYDRLINTLPEFDGSIHGQPVQFRFSAKASENLCKFEAHILKVFPKEEQENKLVAQHLTKFMKLGPALSLLIHLAEWAYGPEPEAKRTINADTANAGMKLAWGYFRPQAKKLYGVAAPPRVQATHHLAAMLRNKQLEDGFSVRDVYKRNRSLLSEPKVVQGAVDDLVEANWLRELASSPGPRGGRPTKRYKINPKI